MKTLKKRIEVEQAYLDGKTVIYKNLKSGYSDKMGTNVEAAVFDWLSRDYYIKPEPMEFWVNVYGGQNVVDAYSSPIWANQSKDRFDGYIKTIKVREVTDE